MSLWNSTISRHDYGHLHLATPAVLNLVNAGQYYQMSGTFTAADFGRFEVSAAGILTYKGTGGVLLLNGVSDVAVDKACSTVYGLHINDTPVPGAETPHTFAATSKIENISITTILSTLKLGDELTVWAKSDTANTALTPSTLDVTLFGGPN